MTPAQLKQWRLDKGLAPPQAAELVGVKTRAWQYWEAGERNVSEPIVIILNAIDCFGIEKWEKMLNGKSKITT